MHGGPVKVGSDYPKYWAVLNILQQLFDQPCIFLSVYIQAKTIRIVYLLSRDHLVVCLRQAVLSAEKLLVDYTQN